MKHWFSDGAFRAIVRNASILGSSNVVSALLSLLADRREEAADRSAQNKICPKLLRSGQRAIRVVLEIGVDFRLRDLRARHHRGPRA